MTFSRIRRPAATADPKMLVAERRIEWLEHGIESLEALGTLTEALGGTIEPVRQCGRRRAQLPPFCPLLAALLPVGGAGTHVSLTDGLPTRPCTPIQYRDP
jgi:hypothetical protein